MYLCNNNALSIFNTYNKKLRYTQCERGLNDDLAAVTHVSLSMKKEGLLTFHNLCERIVYMYYYVRENDIAFALFFLLILHCENECYKIA